MRVYLLLSALFISALLNAQTRISNESLMVEGDSVQVSFTVSPDKTVPSRYKEVIMPYIFNGKDTLMLEACEVYGRGRLMREKQIQHLDGNKTWEPGAHQVLSGDELNYSVVIPVETWMTSANLGVKRHLSGCNCQKDQSDDVLSRDNALYVPKVMVDTVNVTRKTQDTLIVEYKWDLVKEDMDVIFKVSKVELDSTIFNNFKTFELILSSVDRIFADPDNKLDKIEVVGYASPEGTSSFNTWLAENRALVLVDYIISQRPQYGLTRDNFVIRNGKENWEKLRSLLLQSDESYKDAVVAIIDGPLDENKKKLAIKALGGGKVWNSILSKYYPHLRSAQYLALYYQRIEARSVVIKKDELEEYLNKYN